MQLWNERHHALLAAFAENSEHIARAEIAALQSERFGNAQAAAIEQAEHCGIARMNPRLAAVARGDIGIGDGARARHRKRPRQGLADLRRAHGGKRADPALAVALEKAREGARAGERSHQRAAADAVGAPRRHEGAHIGRRQRGKLFQRRRAAEMLGEESEELQHIALIGLDRLWRHAPLGAEMLEPVRDLGGDLGCNGCKFCFRHVGRGLFRRDFSTRFPLSRE